VAADSVVADLIKTSQASLGFQHMGVTYTTSESPEPLRFHLLFFSVVCLCK